MRLCFRFGMVKLQQHVRVPHRHAFISFRFGMVKLQRWLLSQVPQCLSVKDLLSTASTAKKAGG